MPDRVWVQRVAGIVTGVYALQQPGIADEALDETDPAVVAFRAPPRQPRALYAIYTDLQGLSATQKTTVWNDLSSGAPKKYLLDTGRNAAGIAALDWGVTDSGAAAASLLAAKLRLAAMYVQDNPRYLVAPAFDPTINVPGDQ